MTDENPTQEAGRELDETERVTLRLERSCNHFSFAIEFSGETSELNKETSEFATIERLTAAAQLMVYGKGAVTENPLSQMPDIFDRSNVESMVLERPTEESIDAAVEELRRKMKDHLREHQHEQEEGDKPE